MKIAICASPYKEHLTAKQVCNSIEKGLKKSGLKAKYKNFWFADGGLGTAERLSSLFKAKKRFLTVKGPLKKKVVAKYYENKKKKIALFDVSQACGIHLLKKEEKDMNKTDSFGVGQILKEVISHGNKIIFIGLGDTGIIDGGFGMLTAMGYRFLSKKGEPVFCRENLMEVKTLICPNSKKIPKIICLCDGNSTLYGKAGIAKTSGKQKGADMNTIKKIDSEMKLLGRIYEKNFSIKLDRLKKSGSAGGMAAAFASILKARLLGGPEFIIKEFNLNRDLKNFDIIIVGEGQANYQTVDGKAPSIISRKFKKSYLILFVGQLGLGYEPLLNLGIKKIIQTDPIDVSFEEIKNKKMGPSLIENAAFSLGKHILGGSLNEI